MVGYVYMVVASEGPWAGLGALVVRWRVIGILSKGDAKEP